MHELSAYRSQESSEEKCRKRLPETVMRPTCYLGVVSAIPRREWITSLIRKGQIVVDRRTGASKPGCLQLNPFIA